MATPHDDASSGVPSEAYVSTGTAFPAGIGLPIPTSGDHVVFLRGLPVVPWIPLRPATVVWEVWLARLREVALGQLPAPDHAPLARGAASSPALADRRWRDWYDAHVHSVQANRVEDGIGALVRLLRQLGEQAEAAKEDAEAHLVGHSVGGAVALAYLAALRARVHEMPRIRLRAALTLDAAVAGLAGAWSGAKVYLARVTGERVMGDGLRGLNAWALAQGIRILTATNEHDAWSHRTLADLPYLSARLGPRFTLRGQLNGTVHDFLRRTPEFVRAVWGTEGEDAAPARPRLAPPK